VGTFWNGAHDVVTVAGPDGREHLIPLVPDFVLSVDPAGRKIIVRWDAEL
jgi:ribosomal 30S subunit maturation factor RimM